MKSGYTNTDPLMKMTSPEMMSSRPQHEMSKSGSAGRSKTTPKSVAAENKFPKK